MNDIKLIPSENNCYDWSFIAGDVETVNGNIRLVNAVYHALLLKRDEMLQDNYINKGNNAIKYILDLNSETRRKQVIDELILECKKINGITDAKIETTTNGGSTIIGSITLIKDDGREVTVNGI